MTDDADYRPLRAPMTEEEIRASTVGVLRPLSGRIQIVEYDPRWVDIFETEANRIRGALMARALEIEHVGSTSVPALAAKPIVDILLVVQNSAAEDQYASNLERAGYVLRIREPEWHEHRMFKRPATEIHLHVFSKGCLEIGRMLAFRNWLRHNVADRQLYQRTKLSLAQKEWKYGQNYADAKTEIIEEIMRRALTL